MLRLFSKNMKQGEECSIEKKPAREVIRIKKWKNSLGSLEEKINYSFNNIKLLEDALTHSSFIKDSADDKSPSGDKSETMEFLGDSVLELAVTEFLYNEFPSENEGNLTKLRAKIISKKFLFKKASEIKLSNYLLLGDSGLKNKIKKLSSINADSMESLIAAIFLDSSYKVVKPIIKKLILENWENLLEADELQNYKGVLQELCELKFAINPKYEIIKESGSQHKKKFYVRVKIADKYKSNGLGNSKKSAEQSAAKNLLKKLNVSENSS